MPSASEAGVPAEYADRVFDARPDMLGDTTSLLRAVKGEDPAQVIRRLRAHPSAQFDTLSEVVAGAYFLNPEIRELIGYPGRRDIPIETTVEDFKELTAPVTERGSIYRTCP